MRRGVRIIFIVRRKPCNIFCLGYIEEGKWEALSESEREAMMGRVFCLRRHSSQGRSLCGWRSTAECEKCDYPALAGRQGIDNRWSLCRNQGTNRGNPHPRGQGSQSRNPVDVRTPGGKGRTLPDSPDRGSLRNGCGKRTPAGESKRIMDRENGIARYMRRQAASWGVPTGKQDDAAVLQTYEFARNRYAKVYPMFMV